MVKFARKKRVTPSRRRRTFKRRSSRGFHPRAIIGRSLGPGTVTRRLRYTQYVILDPVGAGTAYNIFSANGCYDPDISGVGHQPLGFDQYMLLYGRYTVMGSKITARFCSVATGTTDPIIGGIYLDNDNTPPLSGQFEQLLEQPNNRWRYIGVLTQAKNGSTVTSRYSARKWWHKDTASLMNDDFSGTASNNPSKQAFFSVYAFPADAASNPTGVGCWVTIEYVVKFSTLNTLAQS